MLAIKEDIKYYIFDFCGTLYNGNTSLLFLKFVYKKANVQYKVKFIVYWLIAKILRDLKIINDNGYMKIRVKTLSGMKVHIVSLLVLEFYGTILNKIEIKQTFDFLKELIMNHKKVIILSNTFHFLLEEFPLKENIEILIGSKLRIMDDLLIGKYSSLINQTGKLNVMKKYLTRDDIKNSLFITDNLKSDSDLYNFVNNPVLYKQ
jgi:phosphoserine phosphatase